MSRARELQNELIEAQQQIYDLKTENRVLKMVEKRQESALAKYEGTHAQLPQVIKSYAEDLRSLQTRLRRKKSSYRELENKHSLQSVDLRVVQKNFKHLLDLTKNKQLGEREKLSNQLEEAENTIKQQEKKIQTLMKKIDLQNKTYRNQINVEIKKIKSLKAEMDHMEMLNKKLESNIEKLKYQSYGGRHSYVYGMNQNNFTEAHIEKRTIRTKNSIVSGQDDRVRALTDSYSNSFKPKLVHGEFEISEHTKDLQKNLMKQVHEDVINKPDMLLINTHISSSWLDQGITEVIGEKDLSDECDENIGEFFEQIIIENPFSLSGKKSVKNKQLVMDNSSEDDELSTDAEKNYSQEIQINPLRLISYKNVADNDVEDDDEDEDDDDDNIDVSSISSVSDCSD